MKTDILWPSDYYGLNPLYIDVANLLNVMESKRVGFRDAFYGAGLKWKSSPKAVFALSMHTVNWKSNSDELLRQSGILDILENIPQNILRAVITDLVWRKNTIRGRHKIATTFRSYKNQLKELYCKIEKNIEAQEQSSVRFCRVNTFKSSVEEIISALKSEGLELVETPSSYSDFIDKVKSLTSYEFMVDYHFNNYLVFNDTVFKECNFFEYIKNCSLIVQDKSSEAAVKLLAPKKGSTVLDMCAAPGMKTCSIASFIDNTGTIYACDRNPKRLTTLVKMVEKYCISIVFPMNADSTKNPIKKEAENVDYILLDAPCTGSGMIRRVGEQAADPERIEKLHNLQSMLLKTAMKTYENAKRLVYSTCSLNERENEEVVADVSKVAIAFGWKLVDANKTIKGLSHGNEAFEGCEKCLYFRPEKDMCNGFFIAVFKRISPAQNESYDGKSSIKMTDTDEVSSSKFDFKVNNLPDFCKETKEIRTTCGKYKNIQEDMKRKKIKRVNSKSQIKQVNDPREILNKDTGDITDKNKKIRGNLLKRKKLEETEVKNKKKLKFPEKREGEGENSKKEKSIDENTAVKNESPKMKRKKMKLEVSEEKTGEEHEICKKKMKQKQLEENKQVIHCSERIEGNEISAKKKRKKKVKKHLFEEET